MAYEFRFQDPASDETRYLDEEIIAQFLDEETSEVEAIFAFASIAGVLALLRDAAFESFIRREGRVRLVVGLDAVTDKGALLVLQEAERRFAPYLTVRVFKNRQSGLFHPKLVRAHRRDGSRLLVAGSGNLTLGGLRSNIEAYSVYRIDRTVVEVDAEWDRFLSEHREEISEIDDEALERGARNAERLAAARGAARATRRDPRGRVRREEPAAAVSADEEEIDFIGEVAPSAAPDDRMLVAQVPRAGGRWHQVHFNGEVVRDYFRARPHSADRVLLYRLESGGVVVAEPPRTVVLSGTNLNHRIEFGARAGADYPTDGPPILVVREIGLRSHTYLLVLPGEPGHDEMVKFLSTHPSVGRGARRVITRRTHVASVWPGLPL